MKPIKLAVCAFGPYAAEQVFDFADLRGRSFFLIHGPTGAGKTSILDAICFALYGQASGPQRLPRQLRSDHARPEVRTEVTFDFAIGADLYRVWRIPEQERPKKRGPGTITQMPDATLWRRTRCAAHEEGDPIAGGWREVNDEIQKIMGFEADQFRQVVMLPQGQFQRLLTAKSDERQKILEVLFEVGLFGRIEQALKNASAAARREIEDLRRDHDQLLRAADAASVDALGERRAIMATDLAAVREQAGGLRRSKAEAQARLEIARRVAEKLKESADARLALRALENRAEEFARTELTYARACKAAGLTEAESALHQRRLEAAEGVRRFAAAKSAMTRAQMAQTDAAQTLAAETSRQAQRDAARQRVEQLDALTESVFRLAQAAAEQRTAADGMGTRIKERDAARLALDRARQLIGAAEQSVKMLEADALRLAAFQMAFKESERSLKLCQRLAEARVALASQQKGANSRDDKAGRLRRQYDTARQALNEMEGAWLSGQAAALARGLVDGAACPVCGATHHPEPAPGGRETPTQEAVTQLRQSLLTLEQQAIDARDEAERWKLDAAQRQSEVRTYEDALGEQASVETSSLEQRVRETQQGLARAEEAGIELSKQGNVLTRLRQQEATAHARTNAAEDAAAQATCTFENARTVVSERQAGVPEHLRDPAALDRERSAAARQAKALIDAFDVAKARAADAGLAAASASAAMQGAEEVAVGAQSQADAHSRQFETRLADAGFDSAEIYRAAKLPPAQVEALHRSIQQYTLDKAAARDKCQRAETAAEGAIAPDLLALQSSSDAADLALEASLRREADLAQQLKTADDTLDRIRRLAADLLDREARYQVVGQIAEVAGGKNEYRMTFQRYVLGVFLDEVLQQASLRLQMMSRGRFQLQRVKEAQGGKSAGGLDLEAHDAHTSTTRPVSTLSGGESFLASLSLALGLADVVQAYAGGIRLETIFVDEGFGSLDPEALELAIRALQDLQQGGRLVGIISHVTELKEMIDARLEVLPGTRGSVAKFIVA